ncbi:MAG: hypothetical protein ABR593_11380 [Candidatus Limnocylindria bacterium]
MNFVAYIDPGAGTVLIQALIAGMIAVPFFFRSAISRAVDRIRGRTDVHSEPEPRDSE